MITFTNSSLACARRCLTQYDLRYNLRLERDTDEEGEALVVGTCWHKAHEEKAQGRDPYAAIDWYAPSPIWAEKLRRLFSAYEWYWRDQPFEIVEPEVQFHVSYNGIEYEGKTDGVIKLEDGRLGMIERKTTSEGIDAESNYWNRLRMDPQTGLYAMSLDFIPFFILYDVVRKPTINPKNLTKADVARLRKELTKEGFGIYFGERFRPEDLEPALIEGRETPKLYGARLTADIGDRPDYYFARRPVDRSAQDFMTLLLNIDAQARMILHAQREDLMHRNPDACATFGICTYFGLCSNNVRPKDGDPIPDGYRQREKLHPELD